jgi:hypothetical protein
VRRLRIRARAPAAAVVIAALSACAGGPGPASAAVASACAIPEGLDRMGEAPGLPQIVAGPGVERIRTSVRVELAANGRIDLRTEQVLTNRDRAAARIVAGHAWRIRVADAPSSPLEDIRFVADGSPARAVECRERGSLQAVEPYVDEAHFLDADVPAGATLTIRARCSTFALAVDKPTTLAGFRDRFLDNVRNWAWSYVHAPRYAPLAARIAPLYAALALRAAGRTEIELRAATSEIWWRGLSHEQNAQGPGAAAVQRLAFEDSDRPAVIELEYLPGMPVGEETVLFEALSGERPTDLRAAVRLADLLRFGGEHAQRVAVLRRLLATWDANAGEQLLLGRNDVRGPLTVGLVRSLEAMGLVDEAHAAAAGGVRSLRGLDGASLTEANALALRWLEGR